MGVSRRNAGAISAEGLMGQVLVQAHLDFAALALPASSKRVCVRAAETGHREIETIRILVQTRGRANADPLL